MLVRRRKILLAGAFHGPTCSTTDRYIRWMANIAPQKNDCRSRENTSRVRYAGQYVQCCSSLYNCRIAFHIMCPHRIQQLIVRFHLYVFIAVNNKKRSPDIPPLSFTETRPYSCPSTCTRTHTFPSGGISSTNYSTLPRTDKLPPATCPRTSY